MALFGLGSALGLGPLGFGPQMPGPLGGGGLQTLGGDRYDPRWYNGTWGGQPGGQPPPRPPGYGGEVIQGGGAAGGGDPNQWRLFMPPGFSGMGGLGMGGMGGASPWAQQLGGGGAYGLQPNGGWQGSPWSRNQLYSLSGMVRPPDALQPTMMR